MMDAGRERIGIWVFFLFFFEVKRKFGLYRKIKISAIGRISYFPISHTKNCQSKKRKK